MRTRVVWFLIGAVTASAVWLILANAANMALLDQILGAR